jgi:hypothetical protein
MASSRIPLLLSIFGFAAACSTTSSQSMRAPTTRVRSAVVSTKAAPTDHDPKKPARAKPSPVEESLATRGVRFGTDGSAPALFAFIREHFPTVPVRNATMGDVLFFDMGEGCGGHTGLVETVEPKGRIGFRERRDADTRHSYVTPQTPALRRDEQGRIMNTFLRPKRMDDAPDTAYFAGEMLCAIFHIQDLP